MKIVDMNGSVPLYLTILKTHQPLSIFYYLSYLSLCISVLLWNLSLLCVRCFILCSLHFGGMKLSAINSKPFPTCTLMAEFSFCLSKQWMVIFFKTRLRVLGLKSVLCISLLLTSPQLLPPEVSLWYNILCRNQDLCTLTFSKWWSSSSTSLLNCYCIIFFTWMLLKLNVFNYIPNIFFKKCIIWVKKLN